MPSLRSATATLVLSASLAAAPSPISGAVGPGQYRNFFSEWLGRSEAETVAKLDAVWQQFTSGDPQTQRLFYAGNGDTCYIPDVMHEDVRTEGQSYGMMLAVQTDHQAEFDRLWKWTKLHLYHAEGPFKGYYAWHGRTDGTQLHAGPASDGEEWFVMTLFFAAHRWGNRDGIFNYEQEAQSLLHHILHCNEGTRDPVQAMFDRSRAQVVFVPQNPGNTFTDPSYHLPAFYELWARWAADPADRAFFARAAKTSRDLFQACAHPLTGLMPDYCSFEGKPLPDGGHENFLYDAYRTISNVAVDYAWFGSDPREVDQSRRVLAFLAAQGPDLADTYTLDGRPLLTEHREGLAAMAATAALAVDSPEARLFVRRLWEMPIPSGPDRYYHGLLYYLALLQVSGHYRIIFPASR